MTLTPEETQKTIELLKACDIALDSCRANSEKQAILITQLNDQNTRITQQMIELRDRNNSLVASPLLWFAAGMLVTGLTARLVK